MNTLKTIFLLGLLSALLVAVGYLAGGKDGMLLAFLFSMATNFGSYWFSDKIALSMSGAQPIAREQAPGLYAVVERIAARAQILAPTVYIIPDASPNAFATGRDPEHSSIAVTEGIMQILDQGELEAVLSHELAHVKNRDVLITTIAAVMASIVTMIGHWAMYDREEENRNIVGYLLLILVTPIAAALINLAISRSREYEADSTGAHLCGQPLELASALSKIDSISRQAPMQVNPALSSLYICKPDPGNWFVNLFSTHPPIPQRIERLQKMAGQ